MSKNTYFYNIGDNLDTNFKSITQEKDCILHVCLFKIKKTTKTKQVHSPFLMYLLYKHPHDLSGSHSNVLTFPFEKITTNQNILMKSREMFKNITGQSSKPLGFIKDCDDIYVFFEHNVDTSHESPMLNKEDIWWWGLIDEICNNNKIVNYDIHDTVYTVFYKNPYLMYLIDRKNNPYEIPTVGYMGSQVELINYISTLGTKSSSVREFGPYYYFDNFIGATRRAGWSTNYRKWIINDENTISSNGKIKNGGFVRFALFLGKNKVILYRNTSDFNWYITFFDTNKEITNKEKNEYIYKSGELKGKWTELYDSLTISKIKYKNLSGYFNTNKTHVLKDFNNFIALSTHLLDIKTTKDLWDPFYQKYNIL
jgi:hypothetical protein